LIFDCSLVSTPPQYAYEIDMAISMGTQRAPVTVNTGWLASWLAFDLPSFLACIHYAFAWRSPITDHRSSGTVTDW